MACIFGGVIPIIESYYGNTIIILLACMVYHLDAKFRVSLLVEDKTNKVPYIKTLKLYYIRSYQLANLNVLSFRQWC